ncbi:MAG TPA: 4-oxalocrotonate tautomerase family protein [Polyangiaceae bacterium]|nr:4-oxalocrotonate tautomerase family protein [Polyangiaceae bacterium]
MPIINVKLSETPSPILIQKVSQTVLELTTRILRKRRDVTSIALDFVPREHWIVGGVSLAAQGKSSFYLDIKVVSATNTKDEKAAYVAAMFKAFDELLGDLHPESYVYVHDVAAEAYGYGGVTQEYRYIQGRQAPSEPRSGAAQPSSA